MKMILIIDDVSWFWVWNTETSMWEAWRENGDQPAFRIPANDSVDTRGVLALMDLRAAQVLENPLVRF